VSAVPHAYSSVTTATEYPVSFNESADNFELAGGRYPVL
jgi:hypothetical protein